MAPEVGQHRAQLGEGNQELKAKELALLSDRLSANARTLSGLRNTLMRLRAHMSATRSLG